MIPYMIILMIAIFSGMICVGTMLRKSCMQAKHQGLLKKLRFLMLFVVLISSSGYADNFSESRTLFSSQPIILPPQEMKQTADIISSGLMEENIWRFDAFEFLNNTDNVSNITRGMA